MEDEYARDAIGHVPRAGFLSIGTFSAASRLSQKALRLYDRHGLLRPALTDPCSGYRYYRAEQLGMAKRIVLLREMEMPPDGGVPAGARRGDTDRQHHRPRDARRAGGARDGDGSVLRVPEGAGDLRPRVRVDQAAGCRAGSPPREYWTGAYGGEGDALRVIWPYRKAAEAAPAT